MSKAQRDHANQIADSLKRETVAKYMKGAREHQGNLWELPMSRLIDSSIEEAIDQGVYLKTLQEQLEKLTGIFKDLLVELNYPVEEPITYNAQELIWQIKVILGIE